MKILKNLFEKVEFELPIFLILAVKLPSEQMKNYWLSFLVLGLSTAFLLGKFIRRAEKSTKIFCLISVAFLLSGDIMKSMFMPSTDLSHILFAKTASFLCFLLAVVIIRKPVPFFQKPVFSPVIPVLCFSGILLSPSFVFYFIPVVLLLLVFETNKVNKSGTDPVFLAVLLGSLLITVVIIAVGFAGKYKFMGVVPAGFAFKILARGEIFKTLAAVFPLIALFAVLWRNAYKSASDIKLKRIILLCISEPLFVVLCNIFLYCSYSDGWKYYIFMTVFTQFCLLFYFLDSGERAIAGAFGMLGSFLKKHLLVLLAVAIYLIKISDILYR